MRKIGPTITPPVKHERIRLDHRINFWARVPVSSQANATPRNPQKRAKRKKESTRAGAILPDIIRLNNHIKFTRMSEKEHESKCSDLTQACGEKIVCDTHLSLMNLKQISSGLIQIMTQSSEMLSDWKKFKKIHSRNFGYLSSAINNPEIGREVKLISELVDRFNKIKENLEEYKEDIANKFASPTNPLRQHAPSKPKPERFWRFTRYRRHRATKDVPI